MSCWHVVLLIYFFFFFLFHPSHDGWMGETREKHHDRVKRKSENIIERILQRNGMEWNGTKGVRSDFQLSMYSLVYVFMCRFIIIRCVYVCMYVCMYVCVCFKLKGRKLCSFSLLIAETWILGVSRREMCEDRKREGFIEQGFLGGVWLLSFSFWILDFAQYVIAYNTLAGSQLHRCWKAEV